MTTETVTRAEVENVAAATSVLLPEGVALGVQGRNGYTALDLLHRDEGQPELGGSYHVVRTLYAGTKREVRDYLRAMREGIFLSREPLS